jgi:glycosyltransferase involved in cell wall biosynthesis
VPSGDVQGMAARIVGLASDPARAAAMGAAGRLRVERHFSLPAMVDAYRQLYDRLLAERHTKPRLD